MRWIVVSGTFACWTIEALSFLWFSLFTWFGDCVGRDVPVHARIPALAVRKLRRFIYAQEEMFQRVKCFRTFLGLRRALVRAFFDRTTFAVCNLVFFCRATALVILLVALWPARSKARHMYQLAKVR